MLKEASYSGFVLYMFGAVFINNLCSSCKVKKNVCC